MIDYSLGKGKYEDWIVSETKFSPEALGKAESIMSLGNGYMGLRSALEEPYLGERRNLFINGTFNKAYENEVTELPNLADITKLEIYVDGSRFSLESGVTKDYIRQLNLKTAELTRSFHWTSPLGKELRFHFKRFVSLDNLHLIGMKLEVESLTDTVDLVIKSGINAQVTNSGSQHFLEGERRIHDKNLIQLTQTTSETNIDIVFCSKHKLTVNGQVLEDDPEMGMERRNVWLTYRVQLEPNSKTFLEKLTTVYTSRDKLFYNSSNDPKSMREFALNEMKTIAKENYDSLFTSHQYAWQKKVWDTYNFHVDSERPYDLLAIRFAIYHLTVMTPAHDERMGIGAKGLSGEGYKGHSFWDTEIFILPFFIFSNPEVAKSLLIYRYHGLAGARKKAEDNGYKGAMYPWESAWPTDGEVTPLLGDVDIVTGEQTKIWSGLIEQHITSDIAFAVYQYHLATNDQSFMQAYGYEMIFDTANFWASRLEWKNDKQEYHICNVIGPDEYKEHVDSNAYTNYMAYFNLKLAIRSYEELLQKHPNDFARLDDLIGLRANREDWEKKANQLFLPKPLDDSQVIPQDDTYLSLRKIDLTKYKEQSEVRSIYKDYNPEQINQIQVTKQADVLTLLYLLEQTFLNEDLRICNELKLANFEFYEARTLHDSSLSLAIHALLAADLNKKDLAYTLFKDATEIDLGPAMHSSDDGIHAASIGGIWSIAAFGFAGIRIKNEVLTINPSLPDHWKEISLTFYWRGQVVSIVASKNLLRVEVNSSSILEFESFGRVYQCKQYVEIPYNKD